MRSSEAAAAPCPRNSERAARIRAHWRSSQARISALTEREDEIDRPRHPLPALFLLRELSRAGGRERVISGAAIVLGVLPVGGDEPVTLEAVERAVQRPLVQLEHALR